MSKAIIFVLLLLSSSAFAVDYWACASADAGAANEWDTVSAACTGTKLTYASRVSGAVFHANSFTVVLSQATSGDIGANGTVTLSNDNSAGSTAGGGFTCATATGSTNITANITAGSTSTAALTISGSTGSGCNVGKNGSTVTLTGGTASSAASVSDTHTLIALTAYANATGGSNASAYGYRFSGGSGSVTLNGNGTGGAAAVGFSNGSSGTMTINGNCIGSSTSGAVPTAGCGGVAGAVTVTGNLVYGTTGPPILAALFYFTPAATNYILAAKDSSYSTGVIDTHATEMPTNPGVANVLNGVTYGSYTGTAVTSGANSGSAN